MSERYQELYRIPTNLYRYGSPVIIEAGALLKDLVENKVLAQVKIRNISSQSIVACKIRIWAFEINGNELETVEYSFLDLNISSGGNFGSKEPVYLSNNTTRRYSVAVLEVIFADNTIWSEEPVNWESVSMPRKVSDLLTDKELVKQFEIEAGNNSQYYPEIKDGLFLCTCGTINLANNSSCYKCHRKYDTLIRLLDEEYLSEHAGIRLQKEKEQQEAKIKEEREQQIRKENQKKKIKRVLAIIIPIMVVLITIVALTPGVIKPNIENAISYHKANELLKNGSYDEAKEAFDSLGTYRKSENLSKQSVYEKAKLLLEAKKFDEAYTCFCSINEYLDSDDLSKESMYQKANELYLNKNYEEAIEVWKSVEDYSDSKERIETTDFEWKDEIYASAQALMEEKKYIDASKVFDSISNFKDSKDKAIECILLQNEADYQKALSSVESGDYETAILLFKDLDSYKDSSNLYTSTSYTYAKKCLENKDYINAIFYFGLAKGYVDSDTLKNESYYGYGLQLMNNKEYQKAITQFESCQDYKDSKNKIKESKLGYAKAHKSNRDSTTYSYLKELTDEKYPGAQSLYNEIYAWKIEIYAVNDSKNSNSNMTSVSKNGNIYFHFRVSGGPPNGKETITFKGKLPTVNVNAWTTEVDDGYNGYAYIYYTSGATAGTASMTICDSKGNKLASASISLY